jgi:hypothetical protein
MHVEELVLLGIYTTTIIKILAFHVMALNMQTRSIKFVRIAHNIAQAAIIIQLLKDPNVGDAKMGLNLI